MEIPEKFMEKFRTYSNDEFRKFIESVKSDISVKGIVGGNVSDPDILRLVKCVLVMQVLLERLDKASNNGISQT